MITRSISVFGLLILAAVTAEVLTILFVIFKLTHTINWSWIWITSPTWLMLCLSWAVGMAVLVYALLNRPDRPRSRR